MPMCEKPSTPHQPGGLAAVAVLAACGGRAVVSRPDQVTKFGRKRATQFAGEVPEGELSS